MYNIKYSKDWIIMNNLMQDLYNNNYNIYKIKTTMLMIYINKYNQLINNKGVKTKI